MGHSFDKKNLAAGVKEMRSVAKRLLAWADDLEKAGQNQEEPENADSPAIPAVAAPAGGGSDHGKPVETVKEAQASKPAETVKKAPAPKAPPKLDEVKAFLTKKCAAGYSAQVKALIASFGASSLSGVPAESLAALMEAAQLLGEEGEDANAG